MLEELLQVAAPAVLPLPGPHGHYKRGYGLVLFLNSRGEATAYHPFGERAWQVRALTVQPYMFSKFRDATSRLLPLNFSHNRELTRSAAQFIEVAQVLTCS